jgi:hypothetical protein
MREVFPNEVLLIEKLVAPLSAMQRSDAFFSGVRCDEVTIAITRETEPMQVISHSFLVIVTAASFSRRRFSRYSAATSAKVSPSSAWGFAVGPFRLTAGSTAFHIWRV